MRAVPLYLPLTTGIRWRVNYCKATSFPCVISKQSLGTYSDCVNNFFLLKLSPSGLMFNDTAITMIVVKTQQFHLHLLHGSLVKGGTFPFFSLFLFNREKKTKMIQTKT